MNCLVTDSFGSAMLSFWLNVRIYEFKFNSFAFVVQYRALCSCLRLHNYPNMLNITDLFFSCFFFTFWNSIIFYYVKLNQIFSSSIFMVNNNESVRVTAVFLLSGNIGPELSFSNTGMFISSDAGNTWRQVNRSPAQSCWLYCSH